MKGKDVRKTEKRNSRINEANFVRRLKIMQLKKMRKFLSLLVVLSLVFQLGIGTYALDDSPVGGNTTPEIVLDSGGGSDNGGIDNGADLDKEDAVPVEEDDSDAAEVVTPEALEIVTPQALALAVEKTSLLIKSVEVLNGGSTQILYRPEVYKGVSENGEDPNKFYTTKREINLKDPRIFHVEFTVPKEEITDQNAFLGTVDFTYGGFPLSSWGNGKDLRGKTPIMTLEDKQIAEDGVKYKITADIKVISPYGAGSSANAVNNIPYNGYNGGSQGDFAIDRAQSGDNRPFFQFGPTHKGPGTYELAAVVNEKPLASTDLHIGPYDGYHSWIETNEFCQDLVVALTGKKVDLDKKPLGLLASGTLVQKADGGFEQGDDGVYVEVSILGYGLTDNYNEANKKFNNYSQFNAIWNVVVAKDGETVDDWLEPGGLKDQMNDNPQALIDKYKDADPEDIDFVTPFYQNNVHSDEVTGPDSMIDLITELIAGGKAGKTIPYKTFEDDQISWNYRPSGIESESYSAYNHFVKSDEFSDDSSRSEAFVDTGEILDNFIMVNTLCSNPDGKAAMRRVNRYGMDLNRDTVFATQPETIALTQDIAKWDPIVMLEWHGYVTQMLIEPCTAPHSPNYEPDLTLNNMIQLAYYGGKALTGSTGYNRFHLPWDSMSSGWDDGGNVYGPMFAMLFGCMGWTIELPHSNSDAFDAGNAINYAMLNALLHGETAYYEGNVLNQSIDDKDSHEVDNKYTSLRKSTIMNKLEFKLRGVENVDSEAADKYFIDVVDGIGKYVGRVRKDDGNGGKLPFFPDYLVIPGTPETQFNVAEAYRTLDFTMRYGAKVSKTTAPVTYNGVTYPAGTYLYDMKQGRRNFIAEIMSKGYDATNFASMYADIYCNFPDTRGFDCVEVWSPGLFNGKTAPVTLVEKQAHITGESDDYVVFKSNSSDSVRFVNLLISGRSSGPSFINSKENVWMLRKSVEGVGTMSDYIIEAKNLDKIHALVDNPDLGLKGCHLEGKYISDLPKEAVKLVEPMISLNSTRNAATAGGPIYWALDDYLGFGSMKNEDGTDYNGSSAGVRPGANVALLYNTSASGILVDAIKKDKLGLIMVQNAETLAPVNFGTEAIPRTSSFNDVALYGDYNVDDSIFTANYADTDTIYARGNYFTSNIPAGSKILFRSKDGGAFIGGYQDTDGSKELFQNRTTMFSTILTGGGIVGKPVQSVAFGANMFYRPHYQKYYPMLATAIFAGAAGILDDQINPVVDSVDFVGSSVVVSASDAGSGIDSYALYRWNDVKKEYVLESKRAGGTFSLASGDNKYMIVVIDYAGNEAVKKFARIDGKFVLYSPQAAPDPFTLTFTYNHDGATYTATIPSVENGLYSFDGRNYSSVNRKMDCKPETSYTGYVKYAETGTLYESDAVYDTQITPKLPAGSSNGGGSGTVTPTVPPTTGGALQVNPFTDVKTGDWFYDAVQYVKENGLMNGTSATLFSPHANTTRGMVVTILYRMAGSPAVTAANPFDDVAAGQYYTNAVIWASESKIVTGYGNGKFGPNNAITREQMAVILMNYAKLKGYDVSARAGLSGFDDVASVSGWAQDALSWANAKGLIQGSSNQLTPGGNAERCQVAAILQRFIEMYDTKL